MNLYLEQLHGQKKEIKPPSPPSGLLQTKSALVHYDSCLTTLVSSCHGQVPQCQNSPTIESHAMHSHSVGLAVLELCSFLCLHYFIPCLKL